MIIGSHVHFGTKGLYGACEEAISYNANAFMLYTGAPQNTIRKVIDKKLTNEAHKLMKENNILIENVVCHAPYIVNLANKDNYDYWIFSTEFIKKELIRCEEMGIKYMVLHPGNSLKKSSEEGIKNIIDALNNIVSDDNKCMILLETMAGKGTECGKNIEEIKMILDGVNSKNIGVCLDTCHLNDAGYNMSKFDEFLEEFDKLIGIERIKCIHINDSKNIINSHKDRHENIGFGTIKFDNLLNIINNPKLKDVPKILETPYIVDVNNPDKSYPPYKFEIDMIKKGKFNDNLINDVINYYK